MPKIFRARSARPNILIFIHLQFKTSWFYSMKYLPFTSLAVIQSRETHQNRFSPKFLYFRINDIVFAYTWPIKTLFWCWKLLLLSYFYCPKSYFYPTFWKNFVLLLSYFFEVMHLKACYGGIVSSEWYRC